MRFQRCCRSRRNAIHRCSGQILGCAGHRVGQHATEVVGRPVFFKSLLISVGQREFHQPRAFLAGMAHDMGIGDAGVQGFGPPSVVCRGGMGLSKLSVRTQRLRIPGPAPTVFSNRIPWTIPSPTHQWAVGLCADWGPLRRYQPVQLGGKCGPRPAGPNAVSSSWTGGIVGRWRKTGKTVLRRH